MRFADMKKVLNYVFQRNLTEHEFTKCRNVLGAKWTAVNFTNNIYVTVFAISSLCWPRLLGGFETFNVKT